MVVTRSVLVASTDGRAGRDGEAAQMMAMIMMTQLPCHSIINFPVEEDKSSASEEHRSLEQLARLQDMRVYVYVCIKGYPARDKEDEAGTSLTSVCSTLVLLMIIIVSCILLYATLLYATLIYTREAMYTHLKARRIQYIDV